MENILNFLKEFNLQTIFSMGIMLWYFTSGLKKDLSDKIDKLDSDIRQMNTRISRMEGTVYGKDIYNNLDK